MGAAASHPGSKSSQMQVLVSRCSKIVLNFYSIFLITFSFFDRRSSSFGSPRKGLVIVANKRALY